jgi:hypothetical protein
MLVPPRAVPVTADNPIRLKPRILQAKTDACCFSAERNRAFAALDLQAMNGVTDTGDIVGNEDQMCVTAVGGQPVIDPLIGKPDCKKKGNANLNRILLVTATSDKRIEDGSGAMLASCRDAAIHSRHVALSSAVGSHL